MTNLTITTIASSSTKDLVAAYNEMAVALGEREVNRFADRKTAEKRTAAILARYTEAFPAVEVKRTAAEGIAESWNNPEVAAKRLTRNKVVVDGEEFGSFRKAWAACGFDDKDHIKFRLVMKAEGKVEVSGKTFFLGEQY